MTLKKTLKQLNLSINKAAKNAKVDYKTLFLAVKLKRQPSLDTCVKLNKIGIICTIKNGQIIWSTK